MLRKFISAVYSNSFYFLAGSIFLLVITPLALKALGEVDYGIWVIMLGVMQMAGLANLGVGTTVERYIAKYTASEPRQAELGLSVILTFSYGFMLLAGLLGCLGIWIFKDLIAAQLGGPDSDSRLVASALAVMAQGLPFLFLSQVSRGILYGLFRNRLAGAIDVLQNQLLWLGAIVIGWKSNSVLDQIAAWSLLVNLLGCILFAACAVRVLQSLKLRYRPRLRRELVSELFGYSIFNWASSAGILLFQSTDRLLVGALIGPSAAGAYSIASSVALRVNILAGQFTQALAPAASRYQALGQQADIRRLFISVSRVTSWVLIGSASLLVIWMDRILGYWISFSFADQYAQVFRLMVIAYACFSVSRAAHQTLTGMGLVKVGAFLTVCGASLVLAAIYLLAPANGILGAAAGNFAYMIVLLMNIYLAARLGARTLLRIAADLILPPVILLLVLSLTPAHPSLIPSMLLSLGMTALTMLQLTPFIRKLVSPQADGRRGLPEKVPGLAGK